ncbi:hypothetical protein DOTSEDRAFT_39625 [Dothistroma septosporum NZE10]|uniref:Uncharacterized protein n=1 Tax=Dothistroma septosporum (strain NZE10 / CBS 128990) TaxID=675120 RepID=M2YHS8_DOTSN|nr:hypothetical protein DOTSEDRAFT_39625 [Dothistroma septosporum NZE10]
MCLTAREFSVCISRSSLANVWCGLCDHYDKPIKAASSNIGGAKRGSATDLEARDRLCLLRLILLANRRPCTARSSSYPSVNWMIGTPSSSKLRRPVCLVEPAAVDRASVTLCCRIAVMHETKEIGFEDLSSGGCRPARLNAVATGKSQHDSPSSTYGDDEGRGSVGCRKQ